MLSSQSVTKNSIEIWVSNARTMCVFFQMTQVSAELMATYINIDFSLKFLTKPLTAS